MIGHHDERWMDFALDLLLQMTTNPIISVSFKVQSILPIDGWKCFHILNETCPILTLHVENVMIRIH
jgi:hypothetical protein